MIRPIFVAGMVLVLGCAAAPRPALVGPSEGESRVDWSWRLRDLEGRDVTLEEFRGKVVLINMWATWCPPCVAELASLERLANRVARTGIEILIVSPEEILRVRRFLSARRYTLPAYVEAEPMPESFGLLALPTTWVIDPEGQIVLVHRGAARWDADGVVETLRQLAGVTVGPGTAARERAGGSANPRGRPDPPRTP